MEGDDYWEKEKSEGKRERDRGRRRRGATGSQSLTGRCRSPMEVCETHMTEEAILTLIANRIIAMFPEYSIWISKESFDASEITTLLILR